MTQQGWIIRLHRPRTTIAGHLRTEMDLNLLDDDTSPWKKSPGQNRRQP